MFFYLLSFVSCFFSQFTFPVSVCAQIWFCYNLKNCTALSKEYYKSVKFFVFFLDIHTWNLELHLSIRPFTYRPLCLCWTAVVISSSSLTLSCPLGGQQDVARPAEKYNLQHCLALGWACWTGSCPGSMLTRSPNWVLMKWLYSGSLMDFWTSDPVGRCNHLPVSLLLRSSHTYKNRALRYFNFSLWGNILLPTQERSPSHCDWQLWSQVWCSSSFHCFIYSFFFYYLN